MRVTAAALILAAAATACGAVRKAERVTNVQPPRAGTPGAPADVQGIYRSIHQGLLQLRGDGSFVLIVPEGPGPTSGTFTLRTGRLTVRTSSCGTQGGAYDLAVTGQQRAGQATLHFTAVDDQCAERRHYLTVDPWVYADS